MIDVARPGVDLGHRTEGPAQDVELVNGLVDEDAATLAGLRPAPGIHRVVVGSPPAEDLDGRQPWVADPTCLYRVFNPADRRVPAPLADDRQHDPGFLGGRD